MRETSVLRDIGEVRATKQGYLWIAGCAAKGDQCGEERRAAKLTM